MSFSDDELATILQDIGCTDVQYSGGVMKSKCPCPRSKDRCFIAMPGSGGPSAYHCHRCKAGGRLEDLVWKEWFSGGRPRRALLIVMNRVQEFLCGDKPSPEVTNLEYVPMSDKPRVVWRSEDRPSRPLLGGQLSLTPAPPKPKPVVVSEASVDRFAHGPHPYLSGRGFSDVAQAAYDVRMNKWGSRVVFPVRGWDGELRGYSQRRAYEGPHCPKCKALIGAGKDMMYKCKEPCRAIHAKYMHSKGFRRNASLYGEHLYEEGCVPVIVEGVTDALNLYDKGLRPPLALPLAVMGGSVAKSQAQRVLDRFPGKTIYVVRDHDDPDKYPDLPDGKAPGDIMAESFEATVNMLSPDTDVVHIVPKMGQDPGSLSGDQVFWVATAIENEMRGMLLV